MKTGVRYFINALFISHFVSDLFTGQIKIFDFLYPFVSIKFVIKIHLQRALTQHIKRKLEYLQNLHTKKRMSIETETNRTLAALQYLKGDYEKNGDRGVNSDSMKERNILQ